VYIDDWRHRAVLWVGEGILSRIPVHNHGDEGWSSVRGRQGRVGGGGQRYGVTPGRKHGAHRVGGLTVLVAVPAVGTTERGQGVTAVAKQAPSRAALGFDGGPLSSAADAQHAR
jgi:hypothetical protein